MPKRKQWIINGVVFEYDIKKDNVRDSTDILYDIVGYDDEGNPKLKEVLKLEHFRFTFNERGYVESASKTYNDDKGDWYGNISVYSKYKEKIDIGFGCYRFDGESDPQFNQNEYDRIIAIQEQEKRAAEKQAQLLPAQVTWTAIATGTVLPLDEVSNGPSNDEHSPMYEQIKMWYEMHLWDNKMVKAAYESGLITYEEYIEITQAN